MSSKLGKLVAVHSTSPAFLQRAAILTALSFLFFLIALILYLVRQNFLYFLLATGFLIVQIFTMVGWWMQKRNAVSVYTSGLGYKKRQVAWSEIESIERNVEGTLVVIPNSGDKLIVPASIHGLDRLEGFIRQRLA